jgi:hypothetical protein
MTSQASSHLPLQNLSRSRLKQTTDPAAVAVNHSEMPATTQPLACRKSTQNRTPRAPEAKTSATLFKAVAATRTLSRQASVCWTTTERPWTMKRRSCFRRPKVTIRSIAYHSPLTHAHRHRHRQTHTHTHTHTHTQTDRQTDRQTDTRTHTQTRTHTRTHTGFDDSDTHLPAYTDNYFYPAVVEAQLKCWLHKKKNQLASGENRTHPVSRLLYTYSPTTHTYTHSPTIFC